MDSMEEELEFIPRPEITNPIIQIVNQGLYDYRGQLLDFFKQITSDIDPASPTLELIDELQTESENVLMRYADYILGYISMKESEHSEELGNSQTEDIMDVKFKLAEANESQRRTQVQMDILKGQLERREKMLAEQRALFYKQLLNLREQIFQKNRLGDPYQPDGTDLFNPDAWLDALLGKEGGLTDEEEKKRQTQLLMDKLGAKFAEDRKKLENQMKLLERERNAKILELEHNFREREGELEAKIAQMTEDRNQELQSLTELHNQEMSMLKKAHEDELQQLQHDKEEEMLRLQMEWEARLKKETEELVEQARQHQVKVRELEKQCEELLLQLQQFKNDVDGLKETVKTQKEQIKQVTNERDVAKEELNQLKARTSLKASEIQSMEEKMRLMEEHITQLEADLLEGKKKESDSKRRDNELQKLKDRMKAMEEELMEKNNRISELEAGGANGHTPSELELLRRIRELEGKESMYDAREREFNMLKAREMAGQLQNGDLNNGLSELAAGAEQEKLLKQQRAINNWALLTSRLRHKAMIDAFPELKARAAEEGDEGWLPDGSERLGDDWKKMKRRKKKSFLEKMLARQRAAEEQLRQLRDLIEAERRKNLERVLSAACLLVAPAEMPDSITIIGRAFIPSATDVLGEGEATQRMLMMANERNERDRNDSPYGASERIGERSYRSLDQSIGSPNTGRTREREVWATPTASPAPLHGGGGSSSRSYLTAKVTEDGPRYTPKSTIMGRPSHSSGSNYSAHQQQMFAPSSSVGIDSPLQSTRIRTFAETPTISPLDISLAGTSRPSASPVPLASSPSHSSDALSGRESLSSRLMRVDSSPLPYSAASRDSTRPVSQRSFRRPPSASSFGKSSSQSAIRRDRPGTASPFRSNSLASRLTHNSPSLKPTTIATPRGLQDGDELLGDSTQQFIRPSTSTSFLSPSSSRSRSSAEGTQRFRPTSASSVGSGTFSSTRRSLVNSSSKPSIAAARGSSSTSALGGEADGGDGMIIERDFDDEGNNTERGNKEPVAITQYMFPSRHISDGRAPVTISGAPTTSKRGQGSRDGERGRASIAEEEREREEQIPSITTSGMATHSSPSTSPPRSSSSSSSSSSSTQYRSKRTGGGQTQPIARYYNTNLLRRPNTPPQRERERSPSPNESKER
ncbi:uncharacterized protein MONOS_5345 [Monocercomonoides exilis]|uniref:uncharacterized protein n=1 Tax=Monocercomonoides exilis TaxID=2049356 RepID=UPI003559D6B4|nr:hypothetical protein MONOS_5345 [Monocercomonoides exilis]|eukprot:MONOS_5345.1-p1 / transcript=MONOS_5345.1 / gene=MONOS_5345 / organism=Monocercomonoides_exilis_PA203 / gene_product=unspecified product / transcript_product=unspecified product / location=Mono_scaffold00154:63216-67200(+) / protein_length=1155 / sequence_SO=supercontig / SO=protein_coding / is_pseudo=false